MRVALLLFGLLVAAVWVNVLWLIARDWRNWRRRAVVRVPSWGGVH